MAINTKPPVRVKPSSQNIPADRSGSPDLSHLPRGWKGPPLSPKEYGKYKLKKDGPKKPPNSPSSGPRGWESGNVSAADLSSWLDGPGSSVLGETQGPPGAYKTPFQDPNAMRHWTSQQRRFGRRPRIAAGADPQDTDYWSNLGYSVGGEVKAKKKKAKKTKKTGGYVKKYAKGGGTRKVKT